MDNVKEFEALRGLWLRKIEGLEKESEEVTFHFSTHPEREITRVWRMRHEQECQEHVRLVDFQASLEFPALVHSFQEVTSGQHTVGKLGHDSLLWTFYNVATSTGYLNLRWLGESNGHYSEEVDFKEVEKKPEDVEILGRKAEYTPSGYKIQGFDSLLFQESEHGKVVRYYGRRDRAFSAGTYKLAMDLLVLSLSREAKGGISSMRETYERTIKAYKEIGREVDGFRVGLLGLESDPWWEGE